MIFLKEWEKQVFQLGSEVEKKIITGLLIRGHFMDKIYLFKVPLKPERLTYCV